ncbi:MAG: fused MFS/spermidine synthase [Bacteroidetes bacterium]|jgi:spermidine synthase|nr:fused MFS/spermidine synthase [Bacteroidota bacterium]
MAVKFSVWQRLLSFVVPVKIYKSTSSKNAVLEVTLENGKAVLNSANANYSFGSLYRVYIKALESLNIRIQAKKNILMLGMGAGSVISYLLQKNNHAAIDAVEWDEEVIRIADIYFGIKKNKQLNIYCDDAVHFLQVQKKSYDLILIDLFTDNEVPEFCFTSDFFRLLKNRTQPQGEIVFNASMKAAKSLLNNKDLGGLNLSREIKVEQNQLYLIKNDCV